MTGLRTLALPVLMALTAHTYAAGPKPLRSGFDTMGPTTQAMQQDDAANPGMLSVRRGEQLWAQRAGAAGRSCADCHQDARTTLRGVAARYPRWDAQSGRPVDLSRRIALCRERHQQAEPGGPDDEQRLALTAYVAQAILSEASLSFLGLGVTEPTASWGLMLSGSAADFYQQAPWMIVFPGLAISLAVFAFNLFGDSLRDWLDPKIKI
jgi:mono/diheme cytochrome c family protein